jgi:hypothetical protein
MRTRGVELEDVEVKRAVRGLPSTATKALSQSILAILGSHDTLDRNPAGAGRYHACAPHQGAEHSAPPRSPKRRYRLAPP